MHNQIRNYLLNNSVNADVTELADEQSLLEAGVIDSAAMLDLIMFLEQAFQIHVDEDDMIPENFDSIAAMAEYVAGKQRVAA